ncbi:hypothetical protein BDB01DRAFT_895261 [Pilobolus umbonatus]|nr:hypothetical protein BDB01DRAFT_895261 [Pilobolus umbonatus]
MGNVHTHYVKRHSKSRHRTDKEYNQANSNTISGSNTPSNNSTSIESGESIIIAGRRYPKNTIKHMLPVDELEQDRLLQMHFIYKYFSNCNFSSPVRDLLSGSMKFQQPKRNSMESINLVIENIPPPRVLDLACGIGTWILEMATEFPNAIFYGVDIFPIFPTTVKPANTFFLKHDILDKSGLPYPESYFDYIFMRHVYSRYSEDDWEIIMKEIKRLLKPGGYVELRDMDPVIKNQGSNTHKLWAKYPKIMKEKHHVNIFWTRYMIKYLDEVGCMADLHRQIRSFKLDLPGSVGDMMRSYLKATLESYRLVITELQVFKNDEFDQYVDSVIAEAVKHHSFFNYYCCWGRKSLFDTSQTENSRSIQSRAHSYVSSDTTDNYMRQSLNEPFIVSEIHSSERAASSVTLEDTGNDMFSKQSDPNKALNTIKGDRVSDINLFIEGFED